LFRTDRFAAGLLQPVRAVGAGRGEERGLDLNNANFE
jgi:hypothetical protein